MKRIIWIFFIITMAVLFIKTDPVSAKSGNEKLFTNGTIYLNSDYKVSNLLVKNGIVAGFNVDPSKYPDAQIIDLSGAFAYPGFCDSHVHLLETGGVMCGGINLFNCDNSDKIADEISKNIKDFPEGSPIVGVGYSLKDYNNWSLEDLAKIDKVSQNKPVFLVDSLGHNAIINSETIKLAKLTPETKLSLGGKMVTENGKLTGMLRESAMTIPGDMVIGMMSMDISKKGFLILAEKWASMGYTSIVDMMGIPGVRIMRPEVFFDLEKENKLPLRVNYNYTIFGLKDLNNAVKYKKLDTDLVRFSGCKIFVDGAFGGGQAWTSWKNNQGNHGMNAVFADDQGGPDLNINRIIERAEILGFNMQYHAQGDQAIKVILDALDKVVKKYGKIRCTHTIIHLGFPTDKEIKRIKGFKGKVITTVQPAFWACEEGVDYYYGDRAKYDYPIKKLFDAGISVGLSTDFSVSPLEYASSTKIISVAKTGGNDPEFHKPLSTKDIIIGFTSGSAKVTGKNDTGTLFVGKKADITVFEKDIYDVNTNEFSGTFPKVLSTWLSGRQIYDSNK